MHTRIPMTSTIHFRLLPLLAFLGAGLAPRLADTSICDYYTIALQRLHCRMPSACPDRGVRSGDDRQLLQSNVGVRVPDILSPGIYDGTQGDLLPFFSGGLTSTNEGVCSTGVVQNFLDGSAVPMMAHMAANGTSSSQ